MKQLPTGGGGGGSTPRKQPRIPRKAYGSNPADTGYSDSESQQSSGSSMPADYAASYSHVLNQVRHDYLQTQRDIERSADPRNIDNAEFQNYVNNPRSLNDTSRQATRGPQSYVSSTISVTPPPGFEVKPWMKENPQITAAALRSNLTKDQWDILDRHFRVQRATQELFNAIMVSGEDAPGVVQRQYSSLAPDIRDLAMKNVVDVFNTPAADPTDPDAPEKSYWQQQWDDATTNSFARKSWDGMWAAIGGFYDTWGHAQRTWLIKGDSADPVRNPSAYINEFTDAWKKTEDGSLDQGLMDQIGNQYGKDRVQMILDVNAAMNNPEDPFGPLLDKYGKNNEALLGVIDEWMFEDQRKSDFQDILNGLSAASNGSFGNILTRSLYGYKQADSFAYKATSTATDLTMVIATDPLLFAGKAIKAVRLARYGIDSIIRAEEAGAGYRGNRAVTATAGSIEKLMRKPKVRAYFAQMGKYAEAHNAAATQAEKSIIYRRMQTLEKLHNGGRRQVPMNSSYIPAVETDTAAKVRQVIRGGPSESLPLRDPRTQVPVGIAPDQLSGVSFQKSWWLKPNAAQKIAEYERARPTTLADEFISSGIYTPEQAVDWINSGIGLELILQGKTAYNVPMMPTMGSARRLMEYAKGPVKEPSVRTGGGGIIRRKASGVASTIFDTSAATSESIANDLERYSDELGRESGVSGEAKRIFGISGTKVPVGFDAWARDRRKGFVYAMKLTDRSLAAKADRLRRLTEVAPTTQRFDIQNGVTDAKQIFAWARAAGFQRRHADALAYAWVNGTVGGRRNILRGLYRTTLHAKGIPANDIEAAKNFELYAMEGLSKDTQYGTTIIRPEGYVDQSLTGERLQLAGGEITMDEKTKYLASRIYEIAKKRRELESDYYRTLDLVTMLERSKGQDKRLAELKQHSAQLKADLKDNGDALFNEIRENGRTGALIARTIGLDVTRSVSKAGSDSLREVGAEARSAASDVRSAGDVAIGGVKDSGKAGVNYMYGIAGRSASSSARAAKSDIQDAANAGREVIGDAALGVRAVGESADVGRAIVNDAAAAGRADIKDAYAIQMDEQRKSLDAYRQYNRELRDLNKEIKGSTGRTNLEALLARRDALQAKIDSEKARAGLGRWNINNLVSDEEFLHRWMTSTMSSVRYDPSVVDDVAHALHARQTADHVRLPDFAKLQQVSARTGYLDALVGMSYTNWATSIVDTWSLLTLYGFRYGLRNSIEDLIFYDIASQNSVTGAKNFLKGRKATKAARMAQGQNPGAIHEIVTLKWRPYVTKEELSEALRLRKAGDREAFKQLVAKGMARGRLDIANTKRTSQVDKYIEDLMGTEFIDTMMSQVSETAHNVMRNAGREGGGVVNGPKTLDTLDKNGDIQQLSKPRYINLDFGKNEAAHDAWWTAIHDFAEGDGALGRAAIQGLWRMSRTPAQGRAFVREDVERTLLQIVEKNRDKPWSYYQRFSMIQKHGAETFVKRYLDEAETVFSGRARTILNQELLNRLVGMSKTMRNGQVVWHFDPAKKGVGLFDMVDGQRQYRVGLKDLHDMNLVDKPESIIGPDYTLVSDPKDDSLTDRFWSGMGDLYNRMAKEPMFYARYIEQRDMLSGYEKMMSGMFGEKVGAESAARLAADRAMELLYSYADNPSNRSVLAFNMRNMARYYRATEDFYRRSIRAVKNNPTRVLRDALILRVMNNEGWVHEDDKGQKYFMYPNPMSLFTNSLTSLLGWNDSVAQNVGFKGQFNMLTPSADPNAALPTFSSPFMALPIAAVTSIWQPFEVVQKTTLGERSLGRNLIDAILPPSVASLYYLTNREELTGRYATNLKTVLLAFAASGRIRNGMTTEDLIGTDTYPASVLAQAKTQAEGLTLFQMAMRFWVPSSPNAVVDIPTSDEFAASGLGSLRPTFNKLVTSFKDRGSPDPFGEAFLMWWKINPDLSPFTVAQSTDTSTARIEVSNAGADWITKHEDIYKRSPEAAGYLLPKAAKDDGFSFDALRVYRAYGVKVPKTAEKYVLELASKNAMTEYYAARDDAEQMILSDPDHAQHWRDTWRIWKEGNGKPDDPHEFGFLDRNPIVRERLNSGDTREAKVETLNKLFYVGPDKDREGLLQYIDRVKPQMYKDDPGLMRIRNMVINFLNWKAEYQSLPSSTAVDKQNRADKKAKIKSYLEKQSSGDQRALELYQSLMAPVIEDKVL